MKKQARYISPRQISKEDQKDYAAAYHTALEAIDNRWDEARKPTFAYYTCLNMPRHLIIEGADILEEARRIAALDYEDWIKEHLDRTEEAVRTALSDRAKDAANARWARRTYQWQVESSAGEIYTADTLQQALTRANAEDPKAIAAGLHASVAYRKRTGSDAPATYKQWRARKIPR